MRKNNYNILIVGMTGAGKSVYNRHLLSACPRAIVLDRQGEYSDTPFTRYRDAAKYYYAHPHVDWQIVLAASRPLEYLAMIDTVYRRQQKGDLPPVTMFLDESSLYSSSHNIETIIDNLYTRGRHGLISTVTTAQRMTQINPIIRDQSHVWVSFRLRTMPADIRERFPREEQERLPTLDTLTPGLEPEYGVHYLTDTGEPSPEQALWRLA